MRKPLLRGCFVIYFSDFGHYLASHFPPKSTCVGGGSTPWGSCGKASSSTPPAAPSPGVCSWLVT